MKVYRNENGKNRLIGRADIPDDVGPVYEVYLFGADSTIVDEFTIGVLTHLDPGSGGIRGERAVLVSFCQQPEVLPGWEPLDS